MAENPEVEVPEVEIPKLYQMDLSEILSRIFPYLWKGFFHYAVVVLLGLIPTTIGYVIISLWLFGAVRMNFVIHNPSGMQTLIFILLMVVIGIAFSWATAAITYMASMLYTTKQVSLGAAIGRAFKRWPKLILAGLILALIVVVPGLFFFFLVTSFMDIATPVSIVIVLITILFSIYFAIRLMFIVEAVIVENKSGTQAISRSIELVRGNWWRVFGCSLVFSIIPNVISFGLRFVPFVGNIVAPFIIIPLITIGSTLLYWDLRARYETITVQQAREELGIS